MKLASSRLILDLVPKPRDDIEGSFRSTQQYRHRITGRNEPRMHALCKE
ncbi:MAG TPA: hypothetical protein LFW14_03320 [Rickettsia endosymbiont of Degeeriella rufa]|nr:hypothetical protein [Rickettsia endosymbiont of Columbicola hoogstraali]HJD62589.1 hypothetical protein [Rickettsia endosymbiont of Degeeriella rufa]